MEARQFEQTLVRWYKDMPHLPVGLSKWIAQNLWWIVLVIVIISILNIFWISLLVVGALLPMGVPANSYLGDDVMTVWLTMGVLIVGTIAEAVAIVPLRERRKMGWDILLWLNLASFVVSAVICLVTFQLFDIVGPLIGLAISLYFLFEIRNYFLESKVTKVSGVKPTKKPKEPEANQE